jgi:hypothetical protein
MMQMHLKIPVAQITLSSSFSSKTKKTGEGTQKILSTLSRYINFIAHSWLNETKKEEVYLQHFSVSPGRQYHSCTTQHNINCSVLYDRSYRQP